MASTITLYADTTGKLFAETGSNRTQVIFTYTTAGSITSFTPKTYPGPLEIPGILGGINVTSIGNNAFMNCTGLTSVTFESGSLLTTINYSAFNGCTKLTSISIPASVTSIGTQAFFNCTSLTSISIPVSVTDIGNNAFMNCTGLTSITFASSSKLLTISDGVFSACTSLTSVNIPASVTTIISAAFWGSGLTSITIPASVTSIGENAFRNCAGLKAITFASGSKLLTIGATVFQDCVGLTSIAIPALVTFIGQDAFKSSGLITMYVSTINGLGLTPSTSVTLYGKTFTVKDVVPAVAPTIPICFLAGTKVTTDQGDIAIEKLNPKLHTILGKKIVSITKSAPLKKIFYKGKGVNAIDLVEGYQGAPENNGELLHIVRIKK